MTSAQGTRSTPIASALASAFPVEQPYSTDDDDTESDDSPVDTLLDYDPNTPENSFAMSPDVLAQLDQTQGSPEVLVGDGRARVINIVDLVNQDGELDSNRPNPSNTRPGTAESIWNVPDQSEGYVTDHGADAIDDPLARAMHDPTIQDPQQEAILFAFGLYADVMQLGGAAWSTLAEIVNATTTTIRLPKSLATIKRYRRHIPLAQLKRSPVYLAADPLKITAQASREEFVYFFERKSIVNQWLQHSRQLMYFGPARYVDNLTDPWHGQVWAESICCASGCFPFYPSSGARLTIPNAPTEAIFPADVVRLTNNRLARILRIWKDSNDAWLLEVQVLVGSNNGVPGDHIHSRCLAQH